MKPKNKKDKLYLAREVYNRLKRINLRRRTRYTSKIVKSSNDIYRMLIATILSQNTNDKNSIDAYRNLEKKIGVEIENINRAGEKDIAESILVAGLYNVKAKKIKEVTKILLERYGGDMEKLLEGGEGEARRRLLELPGVGYKTADIILLFTGRKAFPVDTHITRITRRLSLVSEKGSYEEISRVWMEALDPDDYEDAHLQLIAFGRKVCLARKPRCSDCPLNDLCEYYKSGGYG